MNVFFNFSFELCNLHFELFNIKTEEEKVSLERKTREAEQLTARLVDESERRAAEANKLKEELLRARVAEKQAKEKLLEFLSRNAYINTVWINYYSEMFSFESIFNEIFFKLFLCRVFQVCIQCLVVQY